MVLTPDPGPSPGFTINVIFPSFAVPPSVTNKSRGLSPIVTVFGAGIAGLTAAHELIERGFSVQVVEPTRSPDEEYAAEVGGMAANQFGRVRENPSILHARHAPPLHAHDERKVFDRLINEVLEHRNAGMSEVERRFPVPWRIRFGDGSSTYEAALADEWGVRNHVKLVSVWETLKEAYATYSRARPFIPRTPAPGWKEREILYVEIRGHSDGDGSEADNRRLSAARAASVYKELQSLHQADAANHGSRRTSIDPGQFAHHFTCVGVGSAEPIGDQREARWRVRSNRVEFRIVEQLVPGEHGYRFFPAFYRHLSDTMRRTPILDVHGRETGQTAFDHLVPTQDFGIALEDGKGAAILQTRGIRSLEELRRHTELFLHRIGVTYRDIARFQVRLLKFLTSCSERRHRQYEDQSWWTFLGGDAELGYSARMQRYITETPQALVAMNARETDARSQGNIVSQLHLGYLENRFDSTLNGPTSSAWLREWKRYLKRQGVRFFVGEVGKLEWHTPAAPAPTGASANAQQAAAPPLAAGRSRLELVPITTASSKWLQEPNTTKAIHIPRDKSCEEDASKAAHATRSEERYVEPPPAAPGMSQVRVEVVGNDDGDYVISVNGAPYCHRARGQTGEDIRNHLHKLLEKDPLVDVATIDATYILITLKQAAQPKGAGGDVVWVQVNDAHENLRILSAPIPEDPAHQYLSHDHEHLALRPDFYVLALPLEQASRLVWRAERDRPRLLDGSLADLLDFDRATLRRSQTGRELPPMRDEHGRPPAGYPLRDFSGVQYYFNNQVRIGKGHIYYPDAEWGLSSISQLSYWRERMAPTGPFMGQLSVDIGNFYEPAARRPGRRFTRSAWNSTKSEIVAEVWRQIRQGLETVSAGAIVSPSFVHVDNGLRFDDPRGASFREAVQIHVSDASRNARGDFTVWLNGDPHTVAGGREPKTVADALQSSIKNAGYGNSIAVDVDVITPPPPAPSTAVTATTIVAVTPSSTVESSGTAAASTTISTEPSPPPRVILTISSNIEHGTAFVQVIASEPGIYELAVGGRAYRHVHRKPGGIDGRERIRNKLFELIASDQLATVTPLPVGFAGLVLVPRAGLELPPLTILNDDCKLTLSYGPTLNVRLEQCDGALTFESPDQAIVGYNRTPFLINLPGQWRHRPGLARFSGPNVAGLSAEHGRDVRIFYSLSNRRWVPAGTYMATHTRLTTMEAANESARHAVNAILHQLVIAPGTEYNAQGTLFADFAEIWDPENYELDDLAPLKRLDETLTAEGLPHLLDILKVVEAVDGLPMHGHPSAEPLTKMLHVIQHASEAISENLHTPKSILNDLLAQAAGRMQGALDPLGVLGGLKTTPEDLLERLRNALRTFFDHPPTAPSASPGGKEGS